MASRGRGRGRGKSNSSINVISEALGIGRGDIVGLSAPIEPPSTFPPLLRKPQPLTESTHHHYLIALKQEFRNYMRDSPYHIRPETAKSKIERYSDRFKHYHTHKELDWIPNWEMFPSELRMRTSKAAKSKPEIKPRMVGRRADHTSDKELLKKLDKHAKNEKDVSDSESIGGDVFEEELGDDVDEDLDYVQNYYDDDYNAFDDNADDGPILWGLVLSAGKVFNRGSLHLHGNSGHFVIYWTGCGGSFDMVLFIETLFKVVIINTNIHVPRLGI